MFRLHVQTMEIKKIWFILFFFFKEEIQRVENRDGLYEQLVSLWYFLQSLSFMFYETVHTSWKQQSIRKQINRAVICSVWRERESKSCVYWKCQLAHDIHQGQKTDQAVRQFWWLLRLQPEIQLLFQSIFELWVLSQECSRTRGVLGSLKRKRLIW